MGVPVPRKPRPFAALRAAGSWRGGQQAFVPSCVVRSMRRSTSQSGRTPDAGGLRGHTLVSAQDSMDRERVFAESINRKGGILQFSEVLRARQMGHRLTAVGTAIAWLYALINLLTLDLSAGEGNPSLGNSVVLVVCPLAYAVGIPAVWALEWTEHVDQDGPVLMMVHSMLLVLIPTVAVWARGSFANSCGVIIIAAISPIAILTCRFSDALNFIVLGAYCFCVVFTAICESAGVVDMVTGEGLPIRENLAPFMYAIGALAVGGTSFLFLRMTVVEDRVTQERNTALIYSIFPPRIADELLLASVLRHQQMEQGTAETEQGGRTGGLAEAFSDLAKDWTLRAKYASQSQRVRRSSSSDYQGDEDSSVHSGTLRDGSTGDASQVVDALHVIHETGTIACVEVVDFLQICQRFGPLFIMRLLDGVYSSMDAIGSKYSVLRLRTMGHTYMAATGLMNDLGDENDYDDSQTQRALQFCHDIVRESRDWKLPDGTPIVLRVGVCTGPLLSGVIGHLHPQYEVFGDIPVLAGMLCRRAAPGTIFMNESAYSNLERHDVPEGYVIDVHEQNELLELNGKPIAVLKLCAELPSDDGHA